MKSKILFAAVSLFLILGFHIPLAISEENGQEFKQHNPDGGKYEFSRSYISALSYIDNIHKRWKEQNPKERYKDDHQKMFLAYVEYLSLDNTELRIAKNFLVKYLTSVNDLMRKTADVFIGTCDQLIDVNRQERALWQDFYRVHKDKKENATAEEKEFVAKQKDLNTQRQDISKKFIEASFLMTHVMQSENSYIDAPYQLVLTQEQRDKLIKRLDEFAKDNVDWGIKSGQSSFQASVAAIREILEDPIWKSAAK